MKRINSVSLVGLVLALVLYIATNVLFNVSAPTLRLDATENSLYTLSNATYTTLQEVDEPVEFHFFFSDRLAREVPFYASYGRRVRELLTEIVAASNGKIILHTYNPKSFSDHEDRAVRFGVQGIPIDQDNELAYFGLVGTNSVDDIERIPFFQPERETLLEYDLVRMISTLSNAEPTKVGVMGSLPLMGDMQAQLQGGVLIPWPIIGELRKHFDLINLPETVDTLPDDIDVVMIVHPRNINNRALYQLEQFLFRGGRVIMFIDPKSESDLSANPSETSTSADGLQTLFDQWGIDVPLGQLVGDRSMALRINAGTAVQPVPAHYLLWLGVSPDYMSQEDPVTVKLPALNIATPGYIQHHHQSPLVIEPLITSSKNSALISAEEVMGLRPDVLGLLDNFSPDENRYVIAARLHGNVSTAFSDGAPEPLVPPTHPEPGQLMKSNGPINLMIVADSDLLEEKFWLRKQQFFGREVEEKTSGNADLLINAIGNLSGSDELLKLRSRGVSQRPFEKIKALEREAEHRLRGKESQLQDKLKETQIRIAAMEEKTKADEKTTNTTKEKIVLTNEQRRAANGLRQEMLSIRKQLRGVQLELRETIGALQSWLIFINIGLVPIIVLILALALWAIRASTRRRDYFKVRKMRLS